MSAWASARSGNGERRSAQSGSKTRCTNGTTTIRQAFQSLSARFRRPAHSAERRGYCQEHAGIEPGHGLPATYLATLRYQPRHPDHRHSCQYWDLNEQLVISPRASITYKPDWKRNMSFRASGGVYYQPPSTGNCATWMEPPTQNESTAIDPCGTRWRLYLPGTRPGVQTHHRSLLQVP